MSASASMPTLAVAKEAFFLPFFFFAASSSSCSFLRFSSSSSELSESDPRASRSSFFLMIASFSSHATMAASSRAMSEFSRTSFSSSGVQKRSGSFFSPVNVAFTFLCARFGLLARSAAASRSVLRVPLKAERSCQVPSASCFGKTGFLFCSSSSRRRSASSASSLSRCSFSSSVSSGTRGSSHLVLLIFSQ